MGTQPQLIAALTRHAHYEQPEGVPSAHLPHPLTAQGRVQANALADALAVDAQLRGWTLHPTLFCSSLLRAWQTASLAAERLSAMTERSFHVVERDALAERCLGAAANLAVDDIERVLARDPRHKAPPPGWKESRDYRLPLIGAETLEQAGTRVANCLRGVLAEVVPVGDAPTVVVFVGHGAAFRHAAAQLGGLERDLVPLKSMHHAVPIYLATSMERPWQLVAGAWKDRAATARD